MKNEDAINTYLENIQLPKENWLPWVYAVNLAITTGDESLVKHHCLPWVQSAYASLKEQLGNQTSFSDSIN